MTTVLITGSTGLLGRALTAAHVARGDEVHTAQRRTPTGHPVGVTSHRVDVSDAAGLASLVQRVDPDLVLHLAGALRPEPGAADMTQTNVGGTANLLAALARQPAPAALVTASSERAYAPGNGQPLTERHPLAGRGLYGSTKAEADRLTREAGRDGLAAAVLRLSNTYGPDDPVTGRIVPSIVRSVATRAPLHLRSAGAAKRDFLHIADAVAAYLAVGERLLCAPQDVTGRAFNVGTGVGHSVLELVELAAVLAGVELTIDGSDPATGDDEDRLLDAALIASVTGWVPTVALEDGLAAMLAAGRAGLVDVSRS